MGTLAVYGLPEILRVGERYQVGVATGNVSGLTGFNSDIRYDEMKAHLREVRGTQAFGKTDRAFFVSKVTDEGLRVGGALRADASNSKGCFSCSAL